MDMMIIIANGVKGRRNIKKYLRDHDMGNFIAMPSSGTSAILEAYSGYKTSLNSSIDRMSTMPSENETIFALNEKEDMTQKYLDDIAELFGQNEKKQDSGIAFSISVNDIFPKKA